MWWQVSNRVVICSRDKRWAIYDATAICHNTMFVHTPNHQHTCARTHTCTHRRTPAIPRMSLKSPTTVGRGTLALNDVGDSPPLLAADNAMKTCGRGQRWMGVIGGSRASREIFKCWECAVQCSAVQRCTSLPCMHHSSRPSPHIVVAWATSPYHSCSFTPPYRHMNLCVLHTVAQSQPTHVVLGATSSSQP